MDAQNVATEFWLILTTGNSRYVTSAGLTQVIWKKKKALAELHTKRAECIGVIGVE